MSDNENTADSIEIYNAHTDDEEDMEVELVTVTVSTTDPGAHQITVVSNQDQTNSGSSKQCRTPSKAIIPPRVLSPLKDDDGQSCPICFESWTDSGGHRLSSLKCGHLFGQSCIEKWLKGQGGKCPQCNSKAKKADIRVIYAKAIKTVDRSETEKVMKELEEEREKRKRMEKEAAETRLQYNLTMAECKRLRDEVERQRTMQQLTFAESRTLQLSQSTSASAGWKTDSHRYTLDRSIKITENGGCRVMSYCHSLATLVVSQPSAHTVLPGHGIKKINAFDFKTVQYVSLHSQAIRDLSFRPCAANSLLLSCGLDKTLKLTSLLSNTVVQTYKTDRPVWSCIWNSDNDQYFYAGLCNGVVMMYDIRNTSGHMMELNTDMSKSPVVSLQYIPTGTAQSGNSAGILVGQLDRTSFYQMDPGKTDYKLHMLPLSGTLTSLSFDPPTRKLLASFRPSSVSPLVRHEVFTLTSTQTDFDCNLLHTFHGGKTMKLLTRSRLLHHPDNDSLLLCSGDEANLCAKIWDTECKSLKQTISSLSGPIIDTYPFFINREHGLATLTDKDVCIYKWRTVN